MKMEVKLCDVEENLDFYLRHILKMAWHTPYTEEGQYM